MGLRRGEFRVIYECIEGVTRSEVDARFEAHTEGRGGRHSPGSVRMSGEQLAGFLHETFKAPVFPLPLSYTLHPQVLPRALTLPLTLTLTPQYLKAKDPILLEKAATNMLAAASAAAATARSLTSSGKAVSTRCRLCASRLLQCFDTDGDGVLGLDEFSTLYLVTPGTEPGTDAVEAAFQEAAGPRSTCLDESGLGSYLEARLGGLDDDSFEQVTNVMLERARKSREGLVEIKREREVTSYSLLTLTPSLSHLLRGPCIYIYYINTHSVCYLFGAAPFEPFLHQTVCIHPPHLPDGVCVCYTGL